MRQDLCLRGSLLQARKCLITFSICAATFAAARNLEIGLKILVTRFLLGKTLCYDLGYV